MVCSTELGGTFFQDQSIIFPAGNHVFPETSIHTVHIQIREKVEKVGYIHNSVFQLKRVNLFLLFLFFFFLTCM